MNNLFFWRAKDYDIPFGNGGHCSKKELQSPRIRYWKCKNRNPNEEFEWVVLLHSWGRNSKRMITQAQVYWNHGYSLIFIDARSHGQSQFVKVSQGFLYADDVKQILINENIDTPIVHGLSFGAIAASVYAYRNPVRGLVVEALVSDYHAMVYDTLHFLYLPKILFGWIARVLLRMDLPFDEYSPVRTLKYVDAPIFLIHGANDKWFTLDKHFYPNLNSLVLHGNVKSWIVGGSDHSHMSSHPKYKDNLSDFIQQIENKPPLLEV